MLKRFVVVLSLVVGLSMIAPATNASASDGHDGGSWYSWSWSNFKTWLNNRIARIREARSVTATSSGVGVPELDPSAAGSALVLLIGGVAYLTSRRREEEEQA